MYVLRIKTCSIQYLDCFIHYYPAYSIARHCYDNVLRHSIYLLIVKN